jgi:hypothetical protein
VTLLGRDVAEIEALVTDRYLDALLASGDLASGDLAAAPAGRASAGRRASPGGPRLDAAVRLASARLTRDLPRFHPSFRFEERLALRLASAAAAMRLPAAAGAEGSLTVLPGPPPGRPDDFDALADPSPDPDPVRDGPALPRPLLIGGAVAASAISLAGAAWVAWRRSRGAGNSPMARAARAAHAMRERPV